MKELRFGLSNIFQELIALRSKFLWNLSGIFLNPIAACLNNGINKAGLQVPLPKPSLW